MHPPWPPDVPRTVAVLMNLGGRWRFSALNAVQPEGIHPMAGQTTGGNGPISGKEVEFNGEFHHTF
jgi:hypothetical protein